MENKYYVYFHRRLDNNQVFYVGKGCGNRAWVVSGRTEYWHRVVNKYGYTIDIFVNHLTEQEAFDIEIEQIAYHRYIGIKLCNMTDGGEGASGVERTLEQRKQISERQKGSKNFMFGKTPNTAKQVTNQYGEIFTSIKHAAKHYNINNSTISICCNGGRLSSGKHPQTGEKLVWVFVGDEHLIQEKLEALKQPFKKSKAVINQYGEIFMSCKLAAEWCNGSYSSIFVCCQKKLFHSGLHPKHKTKLVWSFLDDENDLKNRVEIMNKQVCVLPKKVMNQFGYVFNSISDAARWCNGDVSHISKSCYGKELIAHKHPVTGEELTWIFVKDYHILSDRLYKILHKHDVKPKSVINQFGDVFESLSEAARWCNGNTNTIKMCCENISKYAYKHPINNDYLVWAYEYEKHTIPEKLDNIKQIRKNIPKKIINQFGDIFNSMAEAARWCGCGASSVSSCCRKLEKYPYAGKHPETGEKLFWRILDEVDNPPHD